MAKIIYLDIDGVMNSSVDKEQESEMSVAKLKTLKTLMDELGIEGIVITSDRRYSPFDIKDKIKTFNKYDIHVFDCIRSDNGSIDDNRGKQIRDHFLLNSQFIDDFLIIDDNDDGISEIYKERFVITNRYDGLSDEIITQIKNIFGR